MKPPRWIVTGIVISSAFPGLFAESRDQLAPAVREVAAGGDINAEFEMASACINGRGVPKDPEKAYKLMKSAAAKGYPDAVGGLGYFHSKGIVVEKNPEEAEKCFRKGAEMGSAKSQFNLGTILLEQSRVPSNVPDQGPTTKETLCKEALAWIKKAADQKMPEAAIAYGKYHYYGEYGAKIDFPTAFLYLKSVADQNNPWVENMLGTMYMRGQGCEKDLSEAERLFRGAAMRDDAKAQANLGRMLGTDSPDMNRRIEALAWLMIGAEQGDVPARKSLIAAKIAAKPEALEKANALKLELRRKIEIATVSKE